MFLYPCENVVILLLQVCLLQFTQEIVAFTAYFTMFFSHTFLNDYWKWTQPCLSPTYYFPYHISSFFFFLPHLFPVILLFIFTKKEWFLLFLCISTQEYFQELNMTKCVSCIFSTLSSLWHYFSLFFHTFIDWILTSLSVVFIMNITTADYDVHSALSAQHFLHVHSDKD